MGTDTQRNSTVRGFQGLGDSTTHRMLLSSPPCVGVGTLYKRTSHGSSQLDMSGDYLNFPYGGLNEKWLHGLICLNSCSPRSETVWGRLGDVALWRKCITEGSALRFQKPMAFLLNYFCLVLID